MGSSPIPSQNNWSTYARPKLQSVYEKQGQPDPPALLSLLNSSDVMNQSEALHLIESYLGIDDSNPSRLISCPNGHEIIIQRSSLPHVVEKRADRRERYVAHLLATLDSPYEIYRVKYDDGTIRHRYIGLFQGKESVQVVTLVRPGQEELLWNFMQSQHKKMDKNRQGDLIYYV